MGAPWNDWYHCNGNTYGTWLPGDPRGWRARHHREHCEGDYKNPPAPGAFDELLAKSSHLMKRDPVRLSLEARRIACSTFAMSLHGRGIDVIAIAIDDHHFHVLARFPDHLPRHWVGLAKAKSARALSDASLVPRGGVWAVRFKISPIKDRAHQVQAAKYIQAHAHRGAAVVTWKELNRV
ncbi:MAG: transposase [Phycisphaerales bacterium]|jgi:hypothetical protein|nr:transposase [Phycisphaerales bacterium]